MHIAFEVQTICHMLLNSLGLCLHRDSRYQSCMHPTYGVEGDCTTMYVLFTDNRYKYQLSDLSQQYNSVQAQFVILQITTIFFYIIKLLDPG